MSQETNSPQEYIALLCDRFTNLFVKIKETMDQNEKLEETNEMLQSGIHDERKKQENAKKEIENQINDLRRKEMEVRNQSSRQVTSMSLIDTLRKKKELLRSLRSSKSVIDSQIKNIQGYLANLEQQRDLKEQDRQSLHEENQFYSQQIKEYKESKANYQEIMMEKLDYMNRQSQKVQFLTEQYEQLQNEHFGLKDETKEQTKYLRKIIQNNAQKKKDIALLEKKSVKISEELDSKTSRLNILMNKYDKLNRNISVCQNLESQYQEIQVKNEELRNLNSEIQSQIALFTKNQANLVGQNDQRNKQMRVSSQKEFQQSLLRQKDSILQAKQNLMNSKLNAGEEEPPRHRISPPPKVQEDDYMNIQDSIHNLQVKYKELTKNQEEINQNEVQEKQEIFKEDLLEEKEEVDIYNLLDSRIPLNQEYEYDSDDEILNKEPVVLNIKNISRREEFK